MDQFLGVDISAGSIFQEVEGRLGMVENKSSFKTTVGEMQRRIDGPEKLNSSNVSCNLRKTKLKNGGEKLRVELAERGVELQLNHRQKSHPTKLTALTEGEAVQLAIDLQGIVREEYPTKLIAKETVTEAAGNVQMDVLGDKESFGECMSALHSALSSVVPPLTGLESKASNNKNLNHAMEEFSMLTHGLGVVTSRIWFEQMKGIGEEMQKHLDTFNQ